MKTFSNGDDDYDDDNDDNDDDDAGDCPLRQMGKCVEARFFVHGPAFATFQPGLAPSNKQKTNNNGCKMSILLH